MKTKIKKTIIQDLLHMPAPFVQTQCALVNTVKLSVCPEPTEGDILDMLIELEKKGYITSTYDEDNERYLYRITSAGKLAGR